MGSKIGIGIANAISFKYKKVGSITPSTNIFDALLLEKRGVILLENGRYIKLERSPSKNNLNNK